MVVCQAVEEQVLVTPSLIAEVVSSSKRDEPMKFELYQLEGVLYYILVYPDERLAKAYINRGEHFTKLGDFSNKTADVDNAGCVLSFAIFLMNQKLIYCILVKYGVEFTLYKTSSLIKNYYYAYPV